MRTLLDILKSVSLYRCFYMAICIWFVRRMSRKMFPESGEYLHLYVDDCSRKGFRFNIHVASSKYRSVLDQIRIKLDELGWGAYLCVNELDNGMPNLDISSPTLREYISSQEIFELETAYDGISKKLFSKEYRP